MARFFFCIFHALSFELNFFSLEVPFKDIPSKLNIPGILHSTGVLHRHYAWWLVRAKGVCGRLNFCAGARDVFGEKEVCWKSPETMEVV